MKSIICFIRHGQTDWNIVGRMQGREEVPLNQTGINQAKEVAHFLAEAKSKGVLWDKVVSGPLSRARDTAKIIANGIDCKNVYSDPRLTERDFGELSGYYYNEYSRAVYENVEGVASIETVESLVERVSDFIRTDVKPGERVIVVTHGGVGRIYAENSPHSENVGEIGMFHNCHTAIYTFDGENVVLERYNLSAEQIAREGIGL